MIGTTLRVAATDAWVLHGVVEGAAGVVEDLAYVDAAGDQLGAGGVDVVYGEGQAVRRAGLRRRDSLAEDNRGWRVVRRQLHDAKVVARCEVGVEPPAEILVERLRAVDVGNAEHHDFELHVDRFFCAFCSFHKSSYEFPAIVEREEIESAISVVVTMALA